MYLRYGAWLGEPVLSFAVVCKGPLGYFGSFLLVSFSFVFGIMREIVHLQAGQCGNQIGAKVSHPD